ncbi:MAG: TRAP transporter substrate-binding protein DctP [Woeseiaceae bacterium]
MRRIGIILIAFFSAGLVNAQTLKIATVTPEGSTWMNEMRASAAEIKQRTDGRVTIKYYGGGSMGTDAQVLKRISIGALQGGAFTPSALMEKYGDIGLYGMPMVFDSEQQASFARSRLDSKIAAGLEEAGFVSFGFAATGFAMIMSNQPVRGLDDLKGKRVWIPEGDDVSRRTMEALSVTPIPLPLTDVYTALQTGALDIVAMSSVGAVILQYHTKLKYVTDTPLVYTFGFMAVDKKAFNKLSADDQLVVRDVMTTLYERYDVKNMEDDRDAKDALFKAGMERIVPSDGELSKLRAVLHETNLKMANEGVVSLSLYEEMLDYVDETRLENETASTATGN